MASSSTRSSKPSSSTGPIRSGRRSSSSSNHHHHHSDAFSSPVLLRPPPTRAKSGCWTCRLRRKKCDENKRSDGSCDTCQRLKIECLGWGAKRPDWCRDKDKVERYKQRVKQQVSFIGGTFRASGAGAVSSSDEYSKEDSTVTMAPPLTPNSTANILGVGTSNDPFSSTLHPTSTPSASDAFEYQPVFISDLGGNTTSTNGFFGTTTASSSSSHPHSHFNPPIDLLDPSELDLSTLLSHLPGSHHVHLMPQTLHPAHWSNQTTPELRSGVHNSPDPNTTSVTTSTSASVNPITSAIDQSMSTIGLIPSSATSASSSSSASSAPNAGLAGTSDLTNANTNTNTNTNSDTPGLIAIPTVPSSTHATAASGGLDYSQFATLPPLYSSGSTGALSHHYFIDPAVANASPNSTTTTTTTGNNAFGVFSPSSFTGTPAIHLAPLDIPSFHQQHQQHQHHSHPHHQQQQFHPAAVTAAAAHLNAKPASTTMLVDAETVREQVMYYFNRVHKTQYPFAGESSKDVLRDIAIDNPYGVVTNALCALASIHDILTRKANGQEAEDPESSRSLPRRFYERANEQLMASKAQNGGSYTSLDATASLQLVSFSVFVGGIRGWENALKIASDWYEKTGVTGAENPLRAMWELNLTAKFASRLTVWYDVLSSVTLHRPARFLSTYRKMLRQDDRETFWRKDLNMQATMGCPDGVLLAIAEIVELAHWRDQEKKRSSLSYRELNRRAELIEQDLKVCRDSLDLQEARAVLANSALAPHHYHNHHHRGRGSSHSSHSSNNTAYFGNAYGNTTTGIGLLNVVAQSAPGTPSSTSGESVLSVINATPASGGPIQLPLPFDSSALVAAAAAAAVGSDGAPIPSPPPSTLMLVPSPSAVAAAAAATATANSSSGSSSMSPPSASLMDHTITGPAIPIGPGEFVLNLPGSFVMPTPLDSPTPSAHSGSGGGMMMSKDPLGVVAAAVAVVPGVNTVAPLSNASLCEPTPSSPAGLSEGDIRRRAGRIFLEGALLYLQSVVSDSNPNVPEVIEGVNATMEACRTLPASDVDRALMFPLFMGGVMAEKEECRVFFKTRLQGVNKGIGNCGEAVKLMEAVWEKRDGLKRSAAVVAAAVAAAASGAAGASAGAGAGAGVGGGGSPVNKQRVHWRDVMEDRGVKLLLA